MGFYENNRLFQEMIRELTILRDMNIKNRYEQGKLLLLAEGSLTVIALEHFLRIFLNEFNPSSTLYNLLQQAIKRGIKLGAKENAVAVKIISNIRNSILHGNYVQAVNEIGLKNIEEYFLKEYIAEVESLYNILEEIVEQVDRDTGKVK